MEKKKSGVFAITVRDKPTVERRGAVDEDIKDAIKRDECRKARRKIIRYIK